MHNLLKSSDWTNFKVKVNYFFTFIFLIEMLVKVIGFGLKEYARDPVNLLDGFITICSILDLLLSLPILVLFRTFRALRILKLLSKLKFMKIVIKVVERKYRHFLGIWFISALHMFIYLLIGMDLYKDELN